VSPGTRGDAQRIADMLEHLEPIRAEIRVGKDQFFEDGRAQKVVAYDLLVLGEAASRVTRATQRANPRVPWTDIVESRNDLTHAYDTLELPEAWDFVRDGLAEIEPRLRSARARLGRAETPGQK
jgi:uncharacterized protein with HEPN domain